MPGLHKGGKNSSYNFGVTGKKKVCLIYRHQKTQQRISAVYNYKDNLQKQQTALKPQKEQQFTSLTSVFSYFWQIMCSWIESKKIETNSLHLLKMIELQAKLFSAEYLR